MRDREPPESSYQDDLRAATELLERVAADRTLLLALSEDERRRFHDAVARVFHPDAGTRRRMVKAVARQRKAAAAERADDVRDRTGIRSLRRSATTPSAFPPPQFAPGDIAPGAPGDDSDLREPLEPQHCYVCKRHYRSLHHFYDQLCPECGDFNFAKRTELADLGGRTALLTGGRVKIGYQAGLKLLRAGARLLVTTRFPRDAATRYAGEPDFAAWGDRLEIFGLDLRHAPSVEAFCQVLLATHDRLDVIVNNACQTVRRPPAFYEHMMAAESASLRRMPPHVRRLLGAYEGLRGDGLLPEGGPTALAGAAEPAALPSTADGKGPAAADWPDAARRDAPGGAIGLTHAAALSQVALLAGEASVARTLFPAGMYDGDLQQVDLRDRNSWRLLLDEVSAVELLEVQLVNAIAPFLLNARLKPLMLRTPGRDRHIVNVSAVEGQFYRYRKTTRHPHTNMAKAALNMMTRTAAADYQQDGIHMNSVDTGWVTDEDAVPLAARKRRDHHFHPPLDIVDGAARILDPVITGINTGVHVWGCFLKDYAQTEW